MSDPTTTVFDVGPIPSGLAPLSLSGKAAAVPPQQPVPYLERVLAVPLNGSCHAERQPVLMAQAVVTAGPREGERLRLGEVNGYVVRVQWTYPAAGSEGLRTADVHVATDSYGSVTPLRTRR